MGAASAYKAGAALRALFVAVCLTGIFGAFELGKPGLAQRPTPTNPSSTQAKATPTPTPTPTPTQKEEEIDPDDVISVETTEILLPVPDEERRVLRSRDQH